MSTVVGMDVHKDTIAAAALDERGREQAVASFDNTDQGHEKLLGWVEELGDVERLGMEASGGIAHQLGRRLAAAGHVVVQVQPRLSAREAKRLRTRGKSDPTDALAIARVVLREPTLPLVQAEGTHEDLKLLVDYREQLWNERTRTANRLHADLAISRPGYQRLIGRSLTSAAALRRAAELVEADRTVRGRLARRRIERLMALDDEIRQLERELKALVAATGTSLTEICGVSALVAARILGEVGDVRRFPTKASFASANGTAPISASSGRTERHRLNRGGNRRLNRALYIVALTQTRHDPRAVAYLARRRAEGKTAREGLRALKRHLSDVVYQQLRQDLGPALTHRS